MGKVIAFDRNRLRSKPQSTALAHRASSQAGAGSRTRIHSFPQKKEEIQVSVVVPACGRPHLLSRCLGALLSQNLEAGRYEIIVVDAKPCPGTRDIVGDWASHAAHNGPALSHISYHGIGGTAAARNRGWRAARGQIVAFIDEDVLVRSDWLDKAFNAFDDEVKAVWGRIMSTPDKSQAGNAVMLPPEQHGSFQTSNYFVRKDTLREVGGFDERFTSSWGEEADLYFRLADQAAGVVHHPRLIALHAEQPATCGTLLSQQKKRLWDALLRKKHPQLFDRKIDRPPYREYYVITAMLTLILLGLLTGAMMIAAGAAILWLGLSVRFARRHRQACGVLPPGLVASFLGAILCPPTGVWWHIVGMLRYRTAYF